MSRIIGKGRYATETYPEAPRSGSGPVAPLEPILLELWVGVMTTPPATPNGSIEAPFPTLQDAFDFVTALPVGANTKVTYFLNSGPGPAFSTTPALGHHNIIGLDERTEIGVLTVAPSAGATLTVSIRNLAGSVFVDGTIGHVFLTITNDAPGVGSFQAADISFGDSGAWSGTVDLVWVNGFVQQCNSPTSRARFYDCQFPAQGTISCLAIDTCANCDIDFHNTVQVFDAPNGLGFVGCNFHNGPVQFDGPPGSIVLDPQSGLTFNTATLLTSGASTNLAADVGDILTVVAPGLPRWTAPSASASVGMMFSPSAALNFWPDSGTPSTFVEVQIDADPFQYSGTTDLTLNGATGVLTYLGASGRSALVRLISSGLVTSAARTNTFQVVSLNGDIVGGLVGTGAWIPAQGQNGMISDDDANLGSIWVCERFLTLNNGDTIRGTFASDFNPTRDVAISNLTLSVLLL